MYILAVDSSTKQSSVCIMKDNECLYTSVLNTNVTHSQNLLTLIQNALSIVGITSNDINLYVSTTGPGSFTGLRINLALIKGLSIANNTPCIGVSSLKALSKSAFISDAVIVSSFDARRNQVYTCIIENENIILDDICINVTNLSEYFKNITKNIFFIGDGATLCYNTFKDLKNVKRIDSQLFCIAHGAAILGYNEYLLNGAKTHFDLEPSYLRLSQAERELKEKLEEQLWYH